MIALLQLLVPLAHSSPLSDAGTATLPLAEVVGLITDRPVAAVRPDGPPVQAVLEEARLEGRLLDEALEAEAHLQVVVLAPVNGWVSIPVLALEDAAHLAALPTLDDAWLAQRDGALTLLTRTPGRYSFAVGLTLPAARTGAQRSVRLALPQPTMSSLALRFDPDRVALDPALRVAREGDAAVLRAADGAYRVAWSARAAATVQEHAHVRREPTVDRAEASVVATLEGTRLFRIRYALELEGSEILKVELPEGPRLERVYVNGRDATNEVGGAVLALPVEPERAGGDSATVELVLVEEGRGFALSGDLTLVFPRVSWPVARLAGTVHLPDVFASTWTGGSLRPAEAPGAEAPWIYDVPTPGSATHWHQELITHSKPSLRLGYTVNLEGSYFGG